MKKLLNITFFCTLMLALAQTATATPVPVSVPDAGSASALLGIAAVGLFAARKFCGK